MRRSTFGGVNKKCVHVHNREHLHSAKLFKEVAVVP